MSATDRIVHISTDARRWNPDHPPLPACARGVGQIERTYHPDRLKYPMRRTGPRGSGQYERISWDEALDTVATQMLRIRETYGNAAILDASRTGSQSMLHGRVAAQRFLYMFGGCTDLWSNMSAEAEVFSVRITYGEKDYKSAGREPTDFVNSRLILMWGWSPGDGTFGTGTMQYLKHAKKNGTRIICVDPRVTMTSRQLADEHVFIRPSTDAAALIAMAYVIVSENLHDQAYCDRYVLGLDEGPVPPGASYKSYLLGLTDGQPKTPEWAAEITGIPAETIRRLAVDVRHHQAGRAASRLCRRPHRLRRAVPPRGLCPGGDHRQCRHQRRQLRRQQWRDRPCRYQKPADRQEPDRCESRLAVAGRSSGAWQGRRLPGGYPHDLFVGRRSVQPVSERRKDRVITGRRRIHCRPGSFPDPNRSGRRHRAARDDLLGA